MSSPAGPSSRPPCPAQPLNRLVQVVAVVGVVVGVVVEFVIVDRTSIVGILPECFRSLYPHPSISRLECK